MNINGWSPLWICIILFYVMDSLSLSVKQGFTDKLMKTKQQLMNNVYQNSRDKNNLKIDTSMLWSEPLYPQDDSNFMPTIFITKNYTLMFHQLDLYALKDGALVYNVSLQPYFNSDIHFVKEFESQDRLFLLVCFQNSICSLYSAKSDLDVTYHQSISDKGRNPTDAQFFIQQGKIFLAILFQKNDCTMSQLRIYQWQSLYMDPELLEPEVMSSATSITVFSFKEDTVFVLRCPGEDHESFKFPSQVWSRKPNGEMTMVQYLPIENPISITHFVERNENFILIMERDRDPSVYWWEGSEFVKWLTTPGMLKYFKVAASINMKYSTFLIFTQSNVLRIYLMTSSRLDQIFEREFSSDDPSEVISILDVKMFERDGSTYMLLLTKSQYHINISLHKVQVQVLNTVAHELSGEMHQDDTTQQDLDTIYSKVRSLKQKTEMVQVRSSAVLLTNKDITINGVVKVSEEIYLENGDIQDLIHIQDIGGYLHFLNTSLGPMRDMIKKSWEKMKITPIYPKRTLVFQESVFVKEAKISSLAAQRVNDRTFEPSLFLASKKSDQTLRSVKAKKVNVGWLAVHEIGEKNISDFIVADSKVNVTVTVANLEMKNLKISENATINNVRASDLSSKTLAVDDNVNKISQIGARKNPAKPGTLQLSDNTVVQNLIVDTIDGLPVNDVLTSVFVRKINNVIHGNVVFQADVRTSEISARKFNLGETEENVYQQIPVYWPSGPPQQLQYLRFWAPLNPYTYDGRRMKRDDSELPKRTIRKLKIKIRGDLKVSKLLFQNSSMVVSNRPVPTTDLQKTFWTVNATQDIKGSVLFSKGLSAKSIQGGPSINGKNLTHYASRGSKFDSLVLEDIFVDGNLNTGDDISLWVPENELQESNLRNCSVKHLVIEKMNGQDTKNLLRNRDLLRKGVTIITENLMVAGDLEADVINNNVTQKFKTAIMIDRDFKLNKVEFKNISGNNIKAKSLNNYSVDALKQLKLKENPTVLIQGDISISQLSGVKLINNYPADFSKVVNKSKGATIYGKKTFKGQVTIMNDLVITNINQVDFEGFIENLLRVSREQNLTGFYKIENAEIRSESNISKMNSISLSSFVHTSQPKVSLLNSIRFKTLAVDGNVTTGSLHGNCLIPKVEENIVFEQSSKWAALDISGDSVWPVTDGGKIQQLFDSAVRTHGNQTITGEVTLHLLSSPNIRVQSMNDKNISFIFHDTLSRFKENQVIKGKKFFLKSFKCKSIQVRGDAQVKDVNNININEINEKLIRHSGDDKETIYGHKMFLSGFNAFKLECPAGINGVKEEDIVSRHSQQTAPPLTIRSLKVFGQLQVEYIDDVHIDSFVEDCIKLKSSERQLIKDSLRIRGNVSLEGEVTTSNINNISTNDVIFINKRKDSIRISGCKRFLTDITILSDSFINTLNDRNLVETYKDNVKVHQDITINGSMVIESAVEVDTVYSKEYFVGPKQLIYLNKTFSP